MPVVENLEITLFLATNTIKAHSFNETLKEECTQKLSGLGALHSHFFL